MSDSLFFLDSVILKCYYLGQTTAIENRSKRHNKGSELAATIGIPGKLVSHAPVTCRSEALKLEKRNKKGRAKPFIEGRKKKTDFRLLNYRDKKVGEP